MKDLNEIKLTITETTNRTMLIPEYITVKELKTQLVASGYKFDNKVLKVYIRHKSAEFATEATDNTYIVNGDSVYVRTMDNYDAVSELKEILKRDIEDAWEEEFIVEHVSVKIIA